MYCVRGSGWFAGAASARILPVWSEGAVVMVAKAESAPRTTARDRVSASMRSVLSRACIVRGR